MKQLLFPMQNLRVTQGYGVAHEGVPPARYSHAGSYALDLGGADTGADWLYAPCDMVVRRVYGVYNAVWFESLEPLESIGTTVIMLCLHMNNADKAALGIRRGKIFRQGERCYREGASGNVTGTHVHIELGRGPFAGTGWKRNAQGVWMINSPLIPSEQFRLAGDVRILDGHGYTWIRAAQNGPELSQSTTPVAGDRVRIRASAVQAENGRRYAPTFAGGRFRLWYDVYTLRSLQGRRAVLAANGAVAAAVDIGILEPAE